MVRSKGAASARDAGGAAAVVATAGAPLKLDKLLSSPLLSTGMTADFIVPGPRELTVGNWDELMGLVKI